MLESLNHTLFYWINATPDSPAWLLTVAHVVAKDLINIVPLLAVGLWLWGPRSQVSAQRQLVIKVALAIVVMDFRPYLSERQAFCRSCGL